MEFILRTVDEKVFFSFSLEANFGTTEGTTTLLTVELALTILFCTGVVTVLIMVVAGGFCTLTVLIVGLTPPVATAAVFTVYAPGALIVVVPGFT